MRKKYYNNKNAVITGAASGIGREIALKLASMGSNLLLSDINMERLEEVKEIAKSFGIKAVSVKCDVSKRSEVDNMAKIAIQEFNEIHFIFSNAGIAIGGLFEYLPFSQWKRIININLWGMIYVVKTFIGKLLSQGFGHIIVTSSIAGTMGVGGLMPYSTTKFANAGFCEALYGEYKDRGIDVSILSPFPLKTNLIETAGIGFPPELIEGRDANEIKQSIDQAKRFYWENFTKKKLLFEGFGGGFTVERAVKRYLKKIRKKKLYIYERRYGRMVQYLKGFWPRSYKKVVKTIGNRNIKLLEDTFDIVK